MEIVRGDFKRNTEDIKASLIPEDEFRKMNIVKSEEEDNRPVVLHVALEAPTYSSHGITEGFRRNGYYVEFFNWQNLKYELGVNGMLERLEAKAKMCKPDLIFLHIQSPDILDVAACKTLTSIAYTVLYTFDCRDREKTQWMYDLSPHLDYVLFSNGEDVVNCFNLGYNNTGVMQSAADIDLYTPNIKKGEYSYSPVCFIGGDYSNSNMNFPKALQRKLMVEYLKKEFPNQFVSYGMGQMENRYIHQNEEAYIYATDKIAIAQNNYSRPLYTSDRIWRIMSSGCFCLTEYYPGITQQFEVGKHLDTWVSLEDLKEKINYYLHFEDERKAIAEAGCQHVRENHSWQKRFEIFSEMIKSKKK